MLTSWIIGRLCLLEEVLKVVEFDLSIGMSL